MDAFFALPDPKMIKAFRDRRAEGGGDACLRPILRSFIKRQMADTQSKFINLNDVMTHELKNFIVTKNFISYHLIVTNFGFSLHYTLLLLTDFCPV